MKDLIDDITKLTDDWYCLIGSDHCKDRDCHWYINTKWSYGNSPVYVVEHYGYLIRGDIGEPCSTYEDALRTLKKILEREIEEYSSYIKNDINENY